MCSSRKFHSVFELNFFNKPWWFNTYRYLKNFSTVIHSVEIEFIS